ncbi:glycoside hydrolase family 3 C-terminal domain-containing protein, partial [Stenotrophomonas sp. SrG]|uniref:glycoside hydrolase family 3 C-terminal domain-containing protein n=1 Tax=Stenotrophomonas sp. SrG TaxID=3414430 RepID=UPI003CF006F7
AAHDALSRDAARRSIVLLKYEGNVLPLRKEGQKIALIGPVVQDRDNIEGCWTRFGDKSRYVTLEAGVRAAIRAESLLEIGPGCDLEAAVQDGIE